MRDIYYLSTLNQIEVPSQIQSQWENMKTATCQRLLTTCSRATARKWNTSPIDSASGTGKSRTSNDGGCSRKSTDSTTGTLTRLK